MAPGPDWAGGENLALTGVRFPDRLARSELPYRLIYPAPLCFNPLNPELNPICYLLALLGAHHFLHVSRIRVKLLTFRLLMSAEILGSNPTGGMDICLL